jgi:tRNA (guanosine-2'-O-)-methyltransferase
MLPRRFQRLRQVLERRQPDLTVVMEGLHKPHNISAILRTCDAVGVYDAHAVYPGGRMPMYNGTAKGSQKWVGMTVHPHIVAAVEELRARGFAIYGTHLSQEAIDFTDVDYTRPTAIIMGTERTGLSDQAAELVDGHILIPMVGMVQSLNVSVAAATILFEAQRQRLLAGMYDHCRLSPEAYHRTLFEWVHPELAERYRLARRPYPVLDDQGNLPPGEPVIE